MERDRTSCKGGKEQAQWMADSSLEGQREVKVREVGLLGTGCGGNLSICVLQD